MKHALLFLLLLCACCAAAQNDSSLLLRPERLMEKDIISRDFGLKRPKTISATRSLEDVDKLPFTVWIITAEDILRYGFVTLGDVLRAAPGMRVSQPGNALEGETFLMRGLSGNQYVKILINDVPVKPSTAVGMPIGAQLPIRQAERIEVMYGPASALYGNEACAGVVNIILKETERPIYTQADLSFGRNGYNNLDLMCGGKLGKDKKIFRFSLYGSSTVRERSNLYYDENLFNPQNYLPFGLDSSLYLNNQNYRADPANPTAPKTAPVSHESRLFGIDMTWRGIHFTYHRMNRTDLSALGINTLAVSWSNPSDRVVEKMETFALAFRRQRTHYVSNTTLSFMSYRISSTSTSTYIFDRLSAADYYAQKQATNPLPDSFLLQQVFLRYAKGERYMAAGGFDARVESRITATLHPKLSLDAGFQAKLGGGTPPTGYLEVPLEIQLFGDLGNNKGAYEPYSDGDVDASLFSQLIWRDSRMTLVAGAATHFSFAQKFERAITPRLGALYRIDSSWTLRANYSVGYRNPSFNNLAQSFRLLPYTTFIHYNALTVPETLKSFEGGFRCQTKDGGNRADIFFFQQEGRNLIRDGFVQHIQDTETGDSLWSYGPQTVPGRGMSMYGIQALLTSQDYDFNADRQKKDKYQLTGHIEFFIQYVRGKEWLGEGLPVIDEVRNQPKWTTQFRTFVSINKVEVMFASNRQTSVLSKAVSYRDFYQRQTIQERYPTYRSWDMMARVFLSNHFLIYFQWQNMFNRHYAGLDATGTPDDLLYNPQQGRSWRLGVNYNMN